MYMLYKTKGNHMYPFYDDLPVPYMPVWVTCGALVIYRHSYPPHLCRTSQCCRTLFTSQCLCGSILPPVYSTVWDWRVSRAGPMHFIGLSCSLPVCLLLFSISLLSFYRLVLWCWGLRTDRVLIALSQLCIDDLF